MVGEVSAGWLLVFPFCMITLIAVYTATIERTAPDMRKRLHRLALLLLLIGSLVGCDPLGGGSHDSCAGLRRNNDDAYTAMQKADDEHYKAARKHFKSTSDSLAECERNN